jgi:signal peptidase II
MFTGLKTTSHTSTRNWRTFSPLLFLTLAWAAFDQVFKLYTLANVPAYPERLEVLPGVLAFAYVENRGAAWGIFDGGILPLTLLRAAAGVMILAFLWRHPSLSRLYTVALALIAGGALGNAYDGLARGFVVDTLLSHTLSALYRPLFGTDFPIFNLADVGVVTGAVLLFLGNLFLPPEGHEANSPSDADILATDHKNDP